MKLILFITVNNVKYIVIIFVALPALTDFSRGSAKTQTPNTTRPSMVEKYADTVTSFCFQANYIIRVLR